MSPIRIQTTAIILIISAFLCGHAFIRRAANGQEDAAIQVQRLAASSATLTIVRGDLLAVGATVREALRGDSGSLTADVLSARRATLRQHLEELGLAANVDPAVILAVRSADEAFGHAAALYFKGEPEAARQVELHTLARRADRLLEHGLQSDAKVIDQQARIIVAVHARLRYIAPLYDVCAVLIAVALLRLGIYSTRKYQSLMKERERTAERRAEELEAFAGRVAHDIKNPLTGLALQIGLLREVHDDKVRGRARSLDGFVRRINGIIDDLLAFARAGGVADRNAKTDVDVAVHDVLQDFETEAKLSNIDLAIGSTHAATVSCAKGPFASMLGNLIRNAMKYLGDRQERSIRVETSEPKAGILRVAVEDTGPGIPADCGEAIFEPFVRLTDTKAPGIGLGLATVKRLAQAHGGSVGVEPRRGGGSRFWFELPTLG